MDEFTGPNTSSLSPSPENLNGSGSYAGVWPPPVNTGPALPGVEQLLAPFTFVYKRLKGSLADFRDGSISVSDEGITIDGRAMPRAEIYTPIMVVLVVLSLLLDAIAYSIMRYGMLRPQQVKLPWSNISAIVLVPQRRWVGLSYSAPNYKGTVKQFCFCFGLQPDQFETFEALARQYAPEVTSVGKLKAGRSIIVLVLVGISVIAAGVGSFLMVKSSH